MKPNLSEMMFLDVYLSSLSDCDYDKIKELIKPSKTKTKPLLSWDIFSQNYFKTLKSLQLKKDINEVKSFAKKAKWKNEIDSVFKNPDFEALIITDIDQNIVWVSDGFTKMTGYSKKYAINKNPKFLQGPSTTENSKSNLRAKLKKSQPFTEIITNYKKDNSSYKCEVKIIPMYKDNITHYLAIEKQVI